MATALLDIAQLAQDHDFRNRVLAAMYVAGRDVSNEGVTAGYESFHQKRNDLATQVLTSGALLYVDQFSWAVAASPAITTESADGDIQWTVNSLWDGMSGVQASEVPPA